MVSALTKNEELTAGTSRALPQKCRDPGIFFVPCTIGDCTIVDAMLDLGASINVMPASIYTSLNFGDLEPTGMIIQLANRSIVQPLGVLEDVLVQVNELIFPADFYVLDMEEETSGKGSTLILGRPFLMTARTKINVHAGTLSTKFGDTLVEFNIFEAMKHPTEDHSLFGMDLLDEMVEEYFQLNNSSEDIEKFVGRTDEISCLGVVDEEADHEEVQDLPNPEDDHRILLTWTLNTRSQCRSYPRRTEATKSSRPKQPKAEIMTVHLVPSQDQVGQTDPSPLIEKSPSLKYAYLDSQQQLPIIIANNLHQEQEDKLLEVLRQHKKAIGWNLSDLSGINPSIYIHRILMEEEVKPIRLNLTLLDVVKKEVTKLLVVGIIYPISDSQWVRPVHVVPKKSGITVARNQHDYWRVCIDYRRLNQATHKDHFPLPFIDQVVEKLSRRSHYCFLDKFSSYKQIHIALEDQHKITFTCPFGTFAYTCMPFALCNAPSTFQRCMTSIFSDFLQDCMEVFMDDFTMYADSFEACLSFYRRFIKNFSKLALPLSKLLLTSAPILQAPNWDLPFILMCDASNLALGVVLGQRAGNHGLGPVELYNNGEGIVGNRVCLRQISLLPSRFEDNCILVENPDTKLTLIRWMLLLQEFDLEIRDKKGVENSVVDHLSRIEKESELKPI
ncbi:hypothetical protein CR513_10529, partial [Mucuna pruriens]